MIFTLRDQMRFIKKYKENYGSFSQEEMIYQHRILSFRNFLEYETGLEIVIKESTFGSYIYKRNVSVGAFILRIDHDGDLFFSNKREYHNTRFMLESCTSRYDYFYFRDHSNNRQISSDEFMNIMNIDVPDNIINWTEDDWLMYEMSCDKI